MMIQDFKNDLLALRVEECKEQGIDMIRVHWFGRACMRDPGKELSSFFQDIEEAAVSTKKSVIFDFTKLEHFNSATIVAVMRMIRQLDRQQIAFTLVYSQKLKWQTMTFDALKQLQGSKHRLNFHAH